MSTLSTRRDKKAAALGSKSTDSPHSLTPGLSASERRFRDYAESAGDWFWEIDADLRYCNFEGVREAILGGTVDRLLGMSRLENLQEMVVDQGLLDTHMADLEARRPFELEFAWQASDGAKRYIRSTGKPIFAEHGEFLGYRGLGRDLTDLRMVEQRATQHSEARLRDFADTAADWFWEMGPDLRFTYLSESYQERTGIRSVDVLGKTRRELLDLVTKKNSPKFDQHLRNIEEHKPFRGFEYEFSHADGSTRVIQLSGKPVYGPSNEFLGYRGSGIDVTEARSLSRELTFQATHDPLTGLINRREFEYRLHRLLVSDVGPPSEHALCYVDLDQFKLVNDTCGHIAGDELLRRLAVLLREKARYAGTFRG